MIVRDEKKIVIYFLIWNFKNNSLKKRKALFFYYLIEFEKKLETKLKNLNYKTQ